MITINKEIDIDITYIKKTYSDINKVLFFDIETTGFSYKKNIIYLIGCTYFINNKTFIIQWLSENENDEYNILYNFINFSKDYNQLIHFNGTSFDIPFITNRASFYTLEFDITNYDSIDIYKLVRPCKHILNLNNCKQKTIEQYLNIYREDKFSGGELIDRFIAFLKTGNTILKTILLKHNEDDIIGLTKILNIHEHIDFYNCMKQQNLLYTINKVNYTTSTMDIYLKTNNICPFTYNQTNQYYCIDMNNESIFIKISLLEDELKYYFKNYKDYYYIKSEDEAVHKQVAKYINKKNKTKATRENCYIKKRGIFIPLPDSYIIENEQIFNSSIKENTNYLLLKENIFNDNIFILKLCNNILSNL
jgi:uncharacterized protein YprB with RNaseH-like and TPR domain